MSQHSDLSGKEVHEPYHYVQEADPGAVGSNLYWLQVSTGTLSRRNGANTGWIVISPQPSEFLTDPTTTKGDIIVRGSSVIGRLPVAANGKLLTTDSTNSLGVSWQDPASATLPTWIGTQPDAPPGSPNALDDEFGSSATLPGGGSALWTWRNQGTATASVANHHLILTAQHASGDDLKILEQNCPSNPWEFTAKIAPEFGPVPANAVMGICAIETGTGKIVVAGFQHAGSGNLCGVYYNSTTSVDTVFGSITQYYQAFYIRLKDDGTNFIFSISHNGIQFYVYQTLSRTAFLGSSANKIGLCIASENNTNNASLDCDWFRRTL